MIEDSKPPSNNFAKALVRPNPCNFPAREMCLFLHSPYLFEPSVRDQLRSGFFWATAYSLNSLRNSASGFQFSDGTIVARSRFRI